MKLLYVMLPLSLLLSCKQSSPPESSSSDGESQTQISTADELEDKPEAQPQGDDRYLGMPIEDAKALAEKEKSPCRVVSVDGQFGMVTMDHRPERLNFTVVDGQVTKVTRG